MFVFFRTINISISIGFFLFPLSFDFYLLGGPTRPPSPLSVFLSSLPPTIYPCGIIRSIFLPVLILCFVFPRPSRSSHVHCSISQKFVGTALFLVPSTPLFPSLLAAVPVCILCCCCFFASVPISNDKYTPSIARLSSLVVLASYGLGLPENILLKILLLAKHNPPHPNSDPDPTREASKVSHFQYLFPLSHNSTSPGDWDTPPIAGSPDPLHFLFGGGLVSQLDVCGSVCQRQGILGGQAQSNQTW